MQIEIKLNDGLKEVIPSKLELTPMFIYFENQNEYYPEKNWIDNPVIVLGWWTYSLVDLLKGGSGQGFSFMEGAFDLNATTNGNDIELRSDDGRINWKVNNVDFANALIAALKKTSRLLYEKGHPELTKGFNEGINQIREALNQDSH